MIAPRWRKVWRDTLDRRGRSLLAVLAMAAGVFEITAMVHKYALLQPALTSMYERTSPASATLTLDRVTDALVDSVARVPGVAVAEARPVVVTRVRTGTDEWVPALLYVVRNFDELRVDTFEPDHGAWPPGPNDVLLERTALKVAKTKLGDSLGLRLDGARDRMVRVTGTVHAAGMPPAWMEHVVTGFIGWNSVLRGGDGESAQIRIVVADHPLDEGYIREVADSVSASLERAGHTVTRITVPTPGRHPHADQMEAFLFLILSFGVLSFALSAMLVAGMVHSWMAEQIRQIGVMKAVGATDRQVAGIYLGQVALLAFGALCIGIPPGLVVGRAYAEFAAGILNTDVSDAPFPLWGIALVIVVGLVVPLLVALGPVRRAARITVHEALSGDPRPMPAHRPGTAIGRERFAWLPRPLRYSLRATLSRPGRIALTIGMLAVGGAAFMSALNVSSAWRLAVDSDFGRRRFDLSVGLADPLPIDSIRAVLAQVPGIEHAEFWPGAAPYLIGPNGVPTTTVTWIGAEPESKLLDLELAAGRWLQPSDAYAAVVNRAVLVRHPGLAVGDSVRLRLKGRTIALAIVGVVKELSPMATVYTPRAVMLAATGQSDRTARSLWIVTRGHDAEAQRVVSRELERAFELAGIEVSAMHSMADQRQGILDHLVIIFSILTAASLVVVAVGCLGLTSMLLLGVVQRTREIGILGAIGATPATIARQVWLEAIVISLLSWAVALVLAAPISWALEATCGNIFFKTPLAFHLSPLAAAVWLLLVLLIASLCSFYPARRAARLDVREALSHA